MLSFITPAHGFDMFNMVYYYWKALPQSYESICGDQFISYVTPNNLQLGLTQEVVLHALKQKNVPVHKRVKYIIDKRLINGCKMKSQP